jgi:hypothetical protein
VRVLTSDTGEVAKSSLRFLPSASPLSLASVRGGRFYQTKPAIVNFEIFGQKTSILQFRNLRS